MSQLNNDREKFEEKIKTLVRLIEKQIKIANFLNKPDQIANLKNLLNIVQSTSFKVMVLGEFKRGKSTFINALLGKEILPAFATPCTAIINEVKWGEKPRAILHFNQVDGQEREEPKEIPVDEIKKYVVIKEDVDQSQAINESPYEKLEIFWPLKLCKDRIEIIDSPGLNEHKTRQQVTESYLVTVDAIILVLSCEQLFSKSEQEVVDNKLLPMGHEDIFFVCNRINLIRRNEVDRVKDSALRKLSSRTRLGPERIFFIDALGALDGKLGHNNEALQKSGVPQLEIALQKFLTNERGRVKIIRPAQELRNAINEVRKTIPEQIAMLKTDVSELEKRYAAAQETLKILEDKRRSIVQKLANSIEDTKELVSYKTKDFCRDLVPKIKTIAQEYQLQTEIKFFSLDPSKKFSLDHKSMIETAVKEVVSYLESQVEKKFYNWQTSELEPLLARKMDNMKTFLDSEAKEFIDRVDNLRLKLSGVSISKVEVSKGDVGVRDVSAVERIFSAAGGFLIGGLGAATIGATFGYQEMLTSLIPQLIIGGIGYIFLGFNPITLIPMLVAALIQGKLMEGGLANRIKEEVGKKFSEQLNQSTVDKVSEAVSVELNKVKNLVDKGLEAEIQNIRQHVKNVLDDKEKGQAEVYKKLKQLDDLTQYVNKIDGELYDLISQV